MTLKKVTVTEGWEQPFLHPVALSLSFSKYQQCQGHFSLSMPMTIFRLTGNLQVSKIIQLLIEGTAKSFRGKSIFDPCFIYFNLNFSVWASAHWEHKGRFHEKSCCSFGFCPNEGGKGGLPKFFVIFHKCIFGQ